MLDNPWNAKPPLDYDTPRRPNVVPLHSTAPRSREEGANSLPAPPPVTTRRAIEARLTKPDLYETLRSAGYRVTLYERACDWFERTFADRIGWFIATLFPLCAAAFCIGYFGLRELLAVFL